MSYLEILMQNLNKITDNNPIITVTSEHQKFKAENISDAEKEKIREKKEICEENVYVRIFYALFLRNVKSLVNIAGSLDDGVELYYYDGLQCSYTGKKFYHSLINTGNTNIVKFSIDNGKINYIHGDPKKVPPKII